ncbi:hypothetical protein [uncultured Roseovarius sp.]|uniref:hypothetical protein n=1 Tax=uncultured Roseovarius sp. TaxID=293344 RepID=UPI00260DE416|nr:hypothetical protein [uncultured Roseovarius sp.]
MQIGLRVYKVQVYHNNKAQILAADKGPADILVFIRNCCANFSKKPLDDGASKVVRFEPSSDFKNSAHGLLKYGKYGYGSEVEDRKSGVVEHIRTVDQADTIPLYYRFWFAAGKSYGLIGLQSFGGSSCVDIVNRALVNTYEMMHPDWRLTMSKLMPNDAKLYGNKVVRSVQLVKKNSSQNIVDRALRPTDADTKMDVELSLKARGRGNFGKLKDLGNKIGDHLEIGDLAFSGAFASVKVGSSFKKIGVLGVSSTAGVIDLTDDVLLDANKHPSFGSVSKETSRHIADFAKILG